MTTSTGDGVVDVATQSGTTLSGTGRESIPDRVSQWVQRHPDQIAVCGVGTELTYAQMWAEASGLAADLIARNVPPGSPVAVALSRSAEFVVAALAVMMAGCHYVPVDPAYPQARQDLILGDSGARYALVADESQWLQRPGVTAIRARSGPAATTPKAVEPPVPAGALAYIIYTSGSTGTPKGVAVTHANVLSLFVDERLAITPGQVVAQLAPTAFDASVFEIWGALCHGARIALLAVDEVSVPAVGRDLRRWRPDWLFLTTGLFHVLVEHDLDGLAMVGTIIAGGDVLSPRLMSLAADAGCALYAAYGPTEGTVFTSLHRIEPGWAATRVPLGTPLAGRSMVVLDERLEPIEDGTEGELYIGGSGVACGYVGRPDETARRYLPDPAAPGRLLYRTGDLGLRRPDGVLEFLGRTDRQVKVRGFRVEPGEVEAALDANEDVESAVVLAKPGPDGERRLVAYVVLRAGSPLTMDELRAATAERLPAYLCPSYYAEVDTLPLDPNGKVDRTALPDPWRSRAAAGLGPYSPPQSGTEALLAEVLAQSLGLDAVSRDDDFFAIGGNSLQSVRVLARLRQAGIALRSRDLFAEPTVVGLAALVDGALTAVDGSSATEAGRS